MHTRTHTHTLTQSHALMCDRVPAADTAFWIALEDGTVVRWALELRFEVLAPRARAGAGLEAGAGADSSSGAMPSTSAPRGAAAVVDGFGQVTHWFSPGQLIQRLGRDGDGALAVTALECLDQRLLVRCCG